MLTNPKGALQKLSARGITTLEQLAESKAHMRKPRRIDLEKALEEIFARSAVPAGSSVRSKIAPPSSTVPIVLNGKRVEYKEIARLDGQPLDYVATASKGGEPVLVVFSNRSALGLHRLQQFKEPLQAINKEVGNALMAGGLQPSPLVPRLNLGLRISLDINWAGSSYTFAPEEYADDLTRFDAGLGWFEGDWNDKISSVQMGRCYCIAWADINQQGARLVLYEDTPNLHIFGWGDAISAIYAPFRN